MHCSCRRLWLPAVVAASLLVLDSRTPAEDWPRYGHDQALTGRSPLRGKIDVPHVSWTFSLAGREMLLELTPASGEFRLRLSADAATEPGPHEVAPAGPLQLDVDGSGVLRQIRETFHERWAKILPDVAGQQRVAWSHTWTDQKVCRLELFAYDKGFDQPRRVWQTDPPEAVIFNPLNIVFDIDGDGVQEICVAAHYRVMIFEGTTGRKETELRYHSCRPYGWFGLVDVDADGQMELVTIGDFQSHIDVLEFDPARPEAERLSVKWRRDIEQAIDRREKWPQVGPRPLADVTGDGRAEIVLNLFNDTGDGQWHVVVLDATTGEVVCDLPRRFVQGAADVDDDGTAEIFVASADGVHVLSCGQIELIALDDRTPTVRWSRREAAWCSADLPQLGSTWSTTASQGMQHVLLGQGPRPVLLVSSRAFDTDGTVSLSAMRTGANNELESLWEIDGLPDVTEAVWLERTEDGGQAQALVRVKLGFREVADLIGRSVRPRIQQSRALGIDVSMPIAAQLCPDDGTSVIVEGPGWKVAAIAPPREPEDAPTLRWQRSGRGMRDGSRALGMLAADLDGDGGCEVIAGDRDKAGHAVLVAYRGDGTTMWQKDFDQIPGAMPAWNVGALTFWWPGRFREPGSIDLLVDTRRGLMHSDMGELVDGRSAATLWKHDKAVVPGQFSWGWGGIPLAAADIDADRRDDLVCLYPVCFWIANGHDGKIRLGRELASRKTLPAWAAYGEPIVYDFNEDGRLEILLDSPYILALLDLDGNPLWHGLGRIDYPVTADEGNAGETTRCKHALADFDGDGTYEIASAGYGDGVRAIDAKTGRVLWSLEAPQPTGPKVAAANIDGRGGDEIIYPAGNNLVAITGDRTSGEVLWTWQGPARLSLPAIADVDGDGSAEIVVQDAEATIHCLDAAP
ncbi:MAG: PQQ-binding-like beta-propeller repeat protein [Planctomycetes bacterium]|nr:PQQ-binding-like beta-propeller repeat protein [Planctomycetota bacterium]MBL7038702.1 PQQ-binding-like beta-propeller repeat protein [Pirellulaceae bacterium]